MSTQNGKQTAAEHREVQFENSGGCWESSAPLDHPWFVASEILISVSGLSRLAPHQEATVLQALNSIDTILDRVVTELGQYDEELKDQGIFRSQIEEPTIFVEHGDGQEPNEWSITVGRPSKWSSYGYHIEFDGLTWKDTWGGG